MRVVTNVSGFGARRLIASTTSTKKRFPNSAAERFRHVSRSTESTRVV
jgi:hypothetical protein